MVRKGQGYFRSIATGQIPDYKDDYYLKGTKLNLPTIVLDPEIDSLAKEILQKLSDPYQKKSKELTEQQKKLKNETKKENMEVTSGNSPHQAEEKKIKLEKDSVPLDYSPIPQVSKKQPAELKMVEIDKAGAQYESALQLFAASKIEEAIELLKSAAEKGHALAQVNLAMRYANGYGVEKNQTQAVNWWEKAAAQECPEAQFRLAVCYDFANGVIQDLQKAVSLYQKAAEKSHPMAQYFLWLCYVEGKGVETNIDQAIEWLQKSAKLELKNAQDKLDEYHRKGLLLKFDDEVKPIRGAALKGLAEAKYIMGLCFARGEGVPKDSLIAFRWLDEAAKQGLAIAQNCLGQGYEDGIPNNVEQAVKWYQEAANQGFVEAQYNLGRCYAEGIGKPENKQKAKFWYQKAAEQNHQLAIEKIKHLSESGTQFPTLPQTDQKYWPPTSSWLNSPVHSHPASEQQISTSQEQQKQDSQNSSETANIEITPSS